MIVTLNLLGIHFFDLIFNPNYLKLFCYVSGAFATLYQVISIILVQRFYKKNMVIPKNLPSFIVEWLKSLECFSRNNELKKYYIEMCVTELCFYFIIITLTTIIIK